MKPSSSEKYNKENPLDKYKKKKTIKDFMKISHKTNNENDKKEEDNIKNMKVNKILAKLESNNNSYSYEDITVDVAATAMKSKYFRLYRPKGIISN